VFERSPSGCRGDGVSFSKGCLRGFSEAAEGTRTLDLLHGKITGDYQIPIIYGLLSALSLVRRDDIRLFWDKVWDKLCPPKRYLMAVARLAQSYVGGNVYLRRGRRAATWYIRWRDGGLTPEESVRLIWTLI
jgi:hypothetical protein